MKSIFLCLSKLVFLLFLFGGQVMAFQYGYDYNQPSQQVSPSQVNIAGSWKSTEGVVTLVQQGSAVRGSYSQDNGAIMGQLQGNILNGYWIESKSSKRCARTLNGSFYWGRIQWRFSGDQFYGFWGYCEAQPGNKWNGKRIGGTSANPGGGIN